LSLSIIRTSCLAGAVDSTACNNIGRQ